MYCDLLLPWLQCTTITGSWLRSLMKPINFELGSLYSKTPLLRPPLDLRKNGLYIGVVLLLS